MISLARLRRVLCACLPLAACWTVVFGLAGCDSGERDGDTIDVGAALGGVAEEGFERAVGPREFRFPEDHGPHSGFRNEWWYLTGNLDDAAGHRFGYQLTFFRIGIVPEPPALDSGWATGTLWMAHAALTDAAAGSHAHDQRIVRGAVGLAGAEAVPLRVWLEDWTLNGAHDGGFPWAIEVTTDSFTLELALEPARSPVLQGDAGLSQKSAEPGNASYYYSIPRLATRGTVIVDGVARAVSGLSWLDREWSTSALGPEQEGWDWFSLQLDDGADLMLYRLRKRGGGSDRHSAGSLTRPGEPAQRFEAGDFSLEPLRFWRDRESGARYPVRWRLRIPTAKIDLEIEAVVDDQLMDTLVRYWEGAVDARDPDSGAPRGRGYLEMTGY